MVALIAAGLSCEKKSLLEKVEAEYARGNYKEAVFLARHHFRRGGGRSPELLFIVGKSLIELGIEAEAGDSFAELYSADTTWAPRIAEVYRDKAMKSLEEGLESKGKRFIVSSINYRGRQDFGEYNSIAGEMMLERKDYNGAIYYLESYIEERSDTTGAASVMMSLGAAYEGSGQKLKAIDLYRLFQERYPKSRMVSTARWKLENLLLGAGEELYSGGETEQAQTLLLELAGSADNPLVREKANFMLGEIYESRNDIENAVLYYSRVVHLNLGSSGRLVDRAKERIEKLEGSK